MSWLFGYGNSSSSSSSKNKVDVNSDDTKAAGERSSNAATALAFRRRAQMPTFTSSKCPPGPGLENSCELPFGFVWTPLAASTTATNTNDGDNRKSNSDEDKMPIIQCPTPSLPPVMCVTCLAYLNPFCTIVPKKNHSTERDAGSGGSGRSPKSKKLKTSVWTCALCDCENVMSSKTRDLVEQALTHTQVEYHQPLIAPGFSSSDSDSNSDEDHKDNQEDNMCTIVLVVDSHLEPDNVRGMMRALQEVLLNQSGNENDNNDSTGNMLPLQVGLVVFGEMVSTYQLGLQGVASADIYSMDVERDVLENRAYFQTISNQQDLESLSQCLSAIFGINMEESISGENNIQATSQRMEILKKRKEARLRQQELQALSTNEDTAATAATTSSMLTFKRSPWTMPKLAAPQRCTGLALQTAVELASIQETRTSRILLFTNGCPNVGEGSVVAVPESTANKSNSGVGTKSKKKKHDTVDGEQLAKAIDFYDSLATLAIEAGIAVDVICAGYMELGLPAYQAMVGPSGGYVIPHSSLDTPHLRHNLSFLMTQTYLSRTEVDLSDGDDDIINTPPKRGLSRFFRRKARQNESAIKKGMSECVLDIRTDSYVIPTHLVGPAELVDSFSSKVGTSRLLQNETRAFREGIECAASKDFDTKDLPSVEALDLSLTRVTLPRADPLATMAVMVQIDDSIEPEEDNYAFFQMIARYISMDGRTYITRITTHRLPRAESVSDYVHHLDDEVVSVLLAKNAVYRSIHGREETDDTKDKVIGGDAETLEKLAYEAQLDLDATIQKVSGAFRLLGLEENTRTLDKKTVPSAISSSLDFAFPPQLSKSVRRLYHLRRGALISPGPLRSMDDRAEVRGLFLRFPLEDCLGMMAPRLWSTGNIEDAQSSSDAATMTRFPAETLALWDSGIVAADQHDVQFVWSGKSCVTDSQVYAKIRSKVKQFLTEKAKNRFPMPEIHMLSDGDSMSRRFTTRLAPSHADSPEQQLANFPELCQLNPTALENLRSRFSFYDAASDASFRAWFWNTSSATHASREDGLSLCE